MTSLERTHTLRHMTTWLRRIGAPALGTLVACWGLTGAVADPDGTTKRIEFESYHQLIELFIELGYTPEAWQAGIREVPRVYITDIPERWRSKTSQEVTTLNKKRLFFRAMAPLVLRANELIMADRERLESIRSGLSDSARRAEEQQAWLLDLAGRYSVELSDGEMTGLDELWTRVDIIPAALALSQCAEESGWGTSRFASQGNALFGQWTWGEHAMKPKHQRKELGNYGLEAFESPQQSVLGYMHNLNTHNAYKVLRKNRREIRAAGQEPSGYELAEGLTSYSERGEEYVKSLHAIMRVNHLHAVDSAYLAPGEVRYLVPVGEGIDID